MHVFRSKRGEAGRDFCRKFLESSDFNHQTLLDIMRLHSQSGGGLKSETAKAVAKYVEAGSISPTSVMLAYVEQPRMWLSFKMGTAKRFPKLNKVDDLLIKVGEESWYGPIKSSGSTWYVRIFLLPDGNSANNDSVIRWPVFARVTSSYLALSWKGFTFKEEIAKPQSQFQFWKYVPSVFSEIEKFLGGQWEFPDLYWLIIEDMWKKYVDSSSFTWRHDRIRAESSGIALNAHASKIREINISGLEGFTDKAARAALRGAGVRVDSAMVKRSRAEVMKTMVKEMGTKSYELTLQNSENEDMFSAHCYFGNIEMKGDQDSLQHLKCSMSLKGNWGALRFLLKELGFDEAS